MNRQQMTELLRKDVVPALGCTEPVCAALCAAGAAKLLEGDITEIRMEVNAGIYKNGMSAGIPNCSHVGIDWAAAIGSVLKNPDKGLELLGDLTPEAEAKAAGLISGKRVTVSVDEEEKNLYVKCTVRTRGEESTCIIRNAHTNVVSLTRNGIVVQQKEETAEHGGEDSLLLELKEMTIEEMYHLVDSAEDEELSFLLDGITMNETLAAYSETRESGVGLAGTIRKEMNGGLLTDGLLSRIVLQVTAAAENRLDGCPLPTMSSSGAGTKGLVVILPVSETAGAIGAGPAKTAKALALAHLLNRYMNLHVGKLSPMCSCVMCSSTAAAAGITYLLGGTGEQVGLAVRNMAGTVTGMICDGGKVGCALKVAAGSFSAFMSALNAVNHVGLRTSDGICGETPEQCIRNMARIGREGMAHTDKVILDIMTERQ